VRWDISRAVLPDLGGRRVWSVAGVLKERRECEVECSHRVGKTKKKAVELCHQGNGIRGRLGGGGVEGIMVHKSKFRMVTLNGGELTKKENGGTADTTSKSRQICNKHTEQTLSKRCMGTTHGGGTGIRPGHPEIGPRL